MLEFLGHLLIDAGRLHHDQLHQARLVGQQFAIGHPDTEQVIAELGDRCQPSRRRVTDRGEHAGVDLAHRVIDDVALVLEVPVEHRMPGPEPLGDVTDRSLVISALGELRQSSLDDLFAHQLSAFRALAFRHGHPSLACHADHSSVSIPVSDTLFAKRNQLSRE